MLEEIEKLKDLHMAGVKFHPPFQKVHLEDGKYREIWERINHLGLPVLIHCGCAKVPSPYDLHPASAEEIIRLLPDVPVILAHMGGLSMDQTGEDRLYRMPENVYIDTAMSAEFQDKDEFERDRWYLWAGPGDIWKRFSLWEPESGDPPYRRNRIFPMGKGGDPGRKRQEDLKRQYTEALK